MHPALACKRFVTDNVCECHFASLFLVKQIRRAAFLSSLIPTLAEVLPVKGQVAVF